VSELAAGGGFTGEKVMEISKRFDTNFPGRPDEVRGHAAADPGTASTASGINETSEPA
jgi:hypothetical protein